MPLRIYLAGPEVFLKQATVVLQHKVTICREHGFEGVSPLDSELNLAGMYPLETGLAISKANEEIMSTCDLVIANATPFRGVSMDVGTAFEMGFMRGQGKPVLAYTNTPDLFFERVAASLGSSPSPSAKILEYEQGMRVEDHGFVDNLMIDGAVLGSQARIVTHRAAPASLYTDLTAFIQCVKMAAGMLHHHALAQGPFG